MSLLPSSERKRRISPQKNDSDKACNVGNIVGCSELSSSSPSVRAPMIAFSCNSFSGEGSSSTADGRQDSKKRHAKAGQWLTPPHMLFPQNQRQREVKERKETTGVAPTKPKKECKRRSMSMGNVQSAPSMIKGFLRKDEETPHRNLKRFRRVSPKQDDSASSAEPRKLGLQRSNSKMSKLMVMSCPNLMAVIYDRLEREDQRRIRRLARNRASARLRRLRKRTVIDQLAIEVMDLENQMKNMRVMLERGDVDVKKAESSSVPNAVKSEERDRGECNIETFISDLHPLLNAFVCPTTKYITSPHQRRENVKFAVEESIAEVKILMRDLALPLVATKSARLAAKNIPPSSLTKVSDLVSVAQKHVEGNRLDKCLGFSEEQSSKIQALENAVCKEMLRLEAIKKCYACTKHRGWHLLDTVDEWNESHTSALSLEQTQRFLKWIKKNKETIARAVPIPNMQ